MTPAQHFQRCGPLCPHVVLCKVCANVYGLCKAHRDDPDGTFSWKEPRTYEDGYRAGFEAAKERAAEACDRTATSSIIETKIVALTIAKFIRELEPEGQP